MLQYVKIYIVKNKYNIRFFKYTVSLINFSYINYNINIAKNHIVYK